MAKRVRGMAMGIAGACCWGASGVFINLLTKHCEVDAVWVGSMRMIIAGIVFLVVALTADRERLLAMLTDRKAMVGVVLFALFGMALFQVTYVLAIDTAGAAAESLIAQVFLVYIMVFTCRANSRLPRKSELVGVFLALAGVFCISTKGNPASLAISGVGLALCLTDSVLQFLHNTLPLYALERYGSLNVNAAGMVLAAIMLAPFGQPWNVPPTLDATGWGFLAGSALIGAALGYLLSMQALTEIGPLLGSLTLVFEPVCSVVLSILFLGTALTFFDVLGVVAILAMMVIMTTAGARDS